MLTYVVAKVVMLSPDPQMFELGTVYKFGKLSGKKRWWTVTLSSVAKSSQCCSEVNQFRWNLGGFAVHACCLNSSTCRRKRKSAATFDLPGISSATKFILYLSDTIISFMRWESFELFLFMTCTTAILSEWRVTEQFPKEDPQISRARTTGRNSRTEIWQLSQAGVNLPKNHFLQSCITGKNIKKLTF